MKQEKSVGAVIYQKQNDTMYVLLVKHTASTLPSLYASHWGFPKGHMKDGETEVETAIRKIKEETNLDATINQTFRETTHYEFAPGVQKEVVYFAATPNSEILLSVHEDVALLGFYSYLDAKNMITYPSDREVLEKWHQWIMTK